MEEVLQDSQLLSRRTWRELGSSSLGCRSHATLFPCCWLSQLRTLCCVLRSSHERTRSGGGEETSAWCIRAPRNRHLQLNLDGHVHRNNIHAAVAWTDRSNTGSYRLPSDGEVGSSLLEVSQSVRSFSNSEQDSHHTRHK